LRLSLLASSVAVDDVQPKNKSYINIREFLRQILKYKINCVTKRCDNGSDRIQKLQDLKERTTISKNQ